LLPMPDAEGQREIQPVEMARAAEQGKGSRISVGMEKTGMM